ncbi:MAG TPA: diguanylate cyclase [Acidimicrobiales bacterium]|nr:diguanylate cyclase [Acidimicrobiales bacterium]
MTAGMSPNRASLILVADDSLVMRALLRRQLEEHGLVVVEAVDGEDAVRMCRDWSPDIILLDVEMPKLDGHGVLVQLQSDPVLADIPVVFLTARTTTDDVVEGLRLGAHDYLRKPFAPAELLARVNAALRVKALQDQLRQRNAELDLMSRTDALTGLPNRRHMQDHLKAVASSACDESTPFGLLIVDIDHFKLVNDTLGHASGDVVLRAIADRLAGACPSNVVAGRWGGEEFVVVAPGTDLTGAVGLGERLREAVAADQVSLGAGPEASITVSVGAAAGVADGESLLRVADAALFRAKRSGRNRVSTADDAR